MFGGKLIGALLSIIYLAIITRSLGPAGFGQLVLIFSFAQAIGGIISFQTWQIIIRYGTKYALDKAHDDFARLVMICLVFDIVGFFLGAVLMLLGIWFLADHLHWDTALQIQVIAFTSVIILAARNTVIGILRVHDRFRDAALAETLMPITRFIGVLLVATLHPTMEGFLIVWALSEIVTTAIMWVIAWRTIPLPFSAQKIRDLPHYFRKYPDLVGFAGYSNLGSSLRLMSQQIIVLIVGFYVGNAAAGFFRLGHQLGQVVTRVAEGLSFAIYSEYNRMRHKDSFNAAQSMIGRTFRVTIVSAAILVAIIIFAGKPFILLMFGAEFAPAFPLFLLLGGASAIQLAAMALEPVLLADGRAGWVLIANFVGALAIALALVLLLPSYAANGAAVAVLFGTIVTVGALIMTYRKLGDPAKIAVT